MPIILNVRNGIYFINGHPVSLEDVKEACPDHWRMAEHIAKVGGRCTMAIPGNTNRDNE